MQQIDSYGGGDRIAATVPAGETLVEHRKVRKFVHQKVQLNPGRPIDMDFPLELSADARAARCGVAVFVQDWLKGNVHQADAVSWVNGSDPGPGAGAAQGPGRVRRRSAR